MRLVKVSTPEGKSAEVVRLALQVGIPEVSVSPVEVHGQDKVERKEEVNVETSTPLAKRFMDAVAEAEWYDPGHYGINVREPRAIVTGKDQSDTITYPFVEPAQDVLQTIWPFAHITPSFVGRVLISAILIAYGMIHNRQLIMASGLLFMPVLPAMLGIGFGALTGEVKLLWRCALVLLTALVLCVVGGLAVGYFAEGPIRFQEFTPMLPAVVLSGALGVAASFATVDDVGWRELIGLGAASQFALIPVWLGAGLLKGWGEGGTQLVTQRIETLVLNVLVLIAVGTAIHAVLGMRRRAAQSVYAGPEREQEREQEREREAREARAA